MNWDLSDNDLSDMIGRSFPGNTNLWTSNNYYPIAMLREFAKINPKAVRNSLSMLFDESKEVSTRIEEYKASMDNLLEEYNTQSEREDKHHYQDGRTISLLLSFKYPSKYSLFKHSILRQFCERLEIDPPKRGHVVNQILINNEVNRLVKSILIQDNKLLQAHEKRLTKNSYIDDDHNILTQDFIYTTVKYNGKHTVPAYYCVGFKLGGNSDELSRFVSEGNWENGHEEQDTDVVKLVPAGSLLAAKTAYTRKRGKETISILEIHNIGKVTSNPKDGNFLQVDWVKDFRPFILEGRGGYRSTITQVRNQELIDLIFYQQKNLHLNTDNLTQNMFIPKNQILYGPPGTGKTFNTINMALEICGEDLDDLERFEIKQLYDERIEQGQIIFTTFHQSMSYEDFIEGIKPIEPEKEGEPVIYKVIEGIFKRACIEASFNFAKENESVETGNVLDFSLAYDNFIQELEERLATENEVELEIKNGGKVIVDSISSQGNVQIKHKQGQRLYTVSKARLSKLQKEIKNLEEVSNINDTFRSIIGGSNSSAYWSVLNAIRQGNISNTSKQGLKRNYTWEEKREVVQSLDKAIFKGRNAKPCVLIIDEINRGNVSAIFGELITLIEKDKRLGQTEELIAQLPYSKDEFGVPPNLFIIGTMNTADRSVEALDSALRRRFSFVEMSPDPDIIAFEGNTRRRQD